MIKKPDTEGLRQEDVMGYISFGTRISEIEKDESKKPLVIFYKGNISPSGQSWCSDCNMIEEKWRTLKKDLNPKGYLVRVQVGTLKEWKAFDFPFAKDPRIRLQELPTVELWKSNKRFSGPNITLENLKSFFTN